MHLAHAGKPINRSCTTSPLSAPQLTQIVGSKSRAAHLLPGCSRRNCSVQLAECSALNTEHLGRGCSPPQASQFDTRTDHLPPAGPSCHGSALLMDSATAHDYRFRGIRRSPAGFSAAAAPRVVGADSCRRSLAINIVVAGFLSSPGQDSDGGSPLKKSPRVLDSRGGRLGKMKSDARHGSVPGSRQPGNAGSREQFRVRLPFGA